MYEINVKTQKDLFDLLVNLGGKVVNTGWLSTDEIKQAWASKRIWVDAEPPNLGLGYVWIPTFQNPFLEAVEEVKLFEQCYPLDVEKPLKIKLSKILNRK